ncbi:MAG TPA: SDR family oxidoreductase [Acidimicrobiales bacterium]|nr:SDR family oxidoreductase [Acidimicrobiales bacterium]
MANVFVTGSSSGIGEAAALHLDRLGHRVFAGVRRDEDADALRAKADGSLTPVRCDVSDAGSVTSALAQIADAVGDAGLDGLVNNAGVARAGPLEHLTIDEWRDQFEINVFGQVAVTKAALPLIRSATGRICFVGSVSGRLGNALMGPYSGSKFAIEGIAQALRAELRPWGIAVSVVEPGPVKTPIWSKAESYADEVESRLGPEATEQYRDQIDTARKGVSVNQRIGVSTDKTTAAIEHALLAPRPKHRYLVGVPAKAIGTATRLLPDRVLDLLTAAVGP